MAPPSKLWKTFTKINQILAKCNLCNQIIKTSGNTSNLKAHLEKHTKKNVDETEGTTKKKQVAISSFVSCSQNSSQVQENGKRKKSSLDNVVDDPDDPDEICSVTSDTHGHGVVAEPSSICIPKQQNIDKMFGQISSIAVGGSQYHRINESIAYYICKDNKPFSTVEGKGFLHMMKQVCPLYKVPSRNTMKNIIDQKYSIVETRFRLALQDINYFSLTTDIWTDTQQMKSFLGLTIHFLENQSLQSGTFGVIELNQSHTAEYISREISKCLNRWSVDKSKIVGITSDNGANMVKAAKELFGVEKHIPCFAHTINLVVENIIKNTDSLLNLLSKVREVVKYFKRSTHASDQLRKRQIDEGKKEGNCKKLILDVSTRWNSVYYMVQRFLELSSLISDILLHRPSAPSMPSAINLQELQGVLVVLRPFENVTLEMSSQRNVTISKVLPLVSCLNNSITSYTPDTELGSKLKDVTVAELNKRFGNIEKFYSFPIATLLDPRFKNLHFKDPDDCSKAITKLKKLVCQHNIISSSSEDDQPEAVEKKFDLWEHHKNLAHQKSKKKSSKSSKSTSINQESASDQMVMQYLGTPVINLSQDPIETWEEMKMVYPQLYNESQKMFCILATSVPSERLFSKAGATLSKERNRLLGKRLSKLLFLNSIDDKYWF